jgi:hypothetical protein
MLLIKRAGVTPVGSYQNKAGVGARWVKVVFSENVGLVLFNPQNLMVKKQNNIILFILHSMTINYFYACSVLKK